MVPTVVREWLAEFKVLSAEEVHSYAASVRHNAELITSLHAVFDEHSNSEILDPICHQLFEFHRCDEKELQRFSLELIPTLIWLYLSMISKGDKANCGGVEAFLLAVYNLETCTADGKPKAKSFRIPTLSQHSIYHEPQLLSNTPLTEAALSHINLEPAEFKDGPHPQYESINGQNRHAILSRLLQCYYGDIANLSARSHRFLCKMCSRIVTTGFSNLSQPEDAIDDDATQAANLAEVLRRTSCSGEMLSRIAVSPTLLIDMLSCLYFTMFNGQPGPASQAIVDIHHRASYELYADVLLVTNAIRNTLRESPSGHPDDGPIGISLALSPASSNYALSKTAITNASFRARKLPDDIPLVQSDEPQAKLPTIEEDGDPGSKTKGLKAKLAKKDKAEKSRLKESRSSDMVPAGILNGDVTDSVQVQVSRSGQKRSIADNIEMSSFNKNTIHNTNKDDNDVFSQPHSGKHNSPAGKTGTAMKNSVSNKDIKNAKMASIGHTRSGSAESTGSEHLSTDL